MNKILKHRAKLVLGFIALLIGISAYYLYNNMTLFECENDQYENFVSPDGQHTAQLYRRNCGATTDYSGHVKLDGKEIFSMNHYYRDTSIRQDSIRLEWLGSNKDLLLSYAYKYSPDDIWTSDTEYNGVKIEYFYWPCIGPIDKIPEGQCLE